MYTVALYLGTKPILAAKKIIRLLTWRNTVRHTGRRCWKHPCSELYTICDLHYWRHFADSKYDGGLLITRKKWSLDLNICENFMFFSALRFIFNLSFLATLSQDLVYFKCTNKKDWAYFNKLLLSTIALEMEMLWSQ